MKTCYGGFCYEHQEEGDYRLIIPSSFSTFMMSLAIVATLFAGTGVLNVIFLRNYLTNNFIFNSLNSNPIDTNNGFEP